MQEDDQADDSRGKGFSESGNRHGGNGSRRRRGNGEDQDNPFQMSALMQMLPLLLAMGGKMRGPQMTGLRLQLFMLYIEILIDLLGTLQDFLQRTLGRLGDASRMGFLTDEDEDEETSDTGTDW
jgi:hypothetical protein